MPSKTVMIRVSEDTKKRLDAEITLLLAAIDQGEDLGDDYNPDAINPAARGVSYDAMIRRMLDAREKHRKRRRKKKDETKQ